MNCRPEDMLVYAVTDRAWLKGESLKDQVEKALKGGVTFVQLREKNLDRRLFLEEAAAIKELCVIPSTFPLSSTTMWRSPWPPGPTGSMWARRIWT